MLLYSIVSNYPRVECFPIFVEIRSLLKRSQRHSQNTSPWSMMIHFEMTNCFDLNCFGQLLFFSFSLQFPLSWLSRQVLNQVSFSPLRCLRKQGRGDYPARRWFLY